MRSGSLEITGQKESTLRTIHVLFIYEQSVCVRRSRIICARSYARFTRATASLISLNVPGTELTGEAATSDLSALSYFRNDFLFPHFSLLVSLSVIMTGAYNNFFRMFDRASRRDVTLEASREVCKRRAVLRPRRVCVGKKRRENDISVDSLDFRKKILHTAWHPTDNIIAIAASNNLYIFQDRHGPGHHGGHQLEQDKPLQLQDTTRQ